MSRTGFPGNNHQKYAINQVGLNSPNYGGGLPNGPSNGFPGQQSNNPQSRLLSRSGNSTPSLSSTVIQPPRPGSAPPPTTITGPSTSTSFPPQTIGMHSSPSTPSGYMPPTNLTQRSNPLMAQNPPLTFPSSNGMTTGNTVTPNLGSPMTGCPDSLRPLSQNTMAGGSYGSALNFSGPQAGITGQSSNLINPTNVVVPQSGPGTGPRDIVPGSRTSYAVPQMTFTPSGQVVGSSGQSLMPLESQPSVGQVGPPVQPSQSVQLPTAKRRVYPNQSYGNQYPTQNYSGNQYLTQNYSGAAVQAPPQPSSTSQTLSPGMYGQQMPLPSQGAMSVSHGNNQYNQLPNQLGKLSVQPSDNQPVNLMDSRILLPPEKDDLNLALPPDLQKKNAKSNILSCTLSNIPENDSLLKKCKLPFGILVHPFKDLTNLAVIQSSTIVRCRSCRTYINPFVTFTDSRRWKCNMCYRMNEVPEEFCYDPTTRSYGDPTRRPEIKSATYEFIAPSEYMLRAPQPAAFVFAFDVSFNAVETGYLKIACETIKENLDRMPGDSRALIGFLTFNKSVNFYDLRNDHSQPHMLIVSEIDDIFLPAPEDLLVNLKENKEMILQFLDSLPETFSSTQDINCASGAAMQAALKLMAPTGGRITIFQTTLPNAGPGALENRDEPGVKSSPKDASKLNPATDFYKKLALDCAADQVSIDIFLLSSQYADCSSLLCASKYSGGCFLYFPNFHISKNRAMVERFQNDLTRYLTRKIGFEAVMRVRCTKGLGIHTFHGNFFVRSTDLLSLPNVNPDSSFGMQISIEDNLSDSGVACFQSALLYTSSRGERRIRVHNLALPVTKKMSDVYAGANASAIALMLSKMAVDRTLTASLGDAREALMNAIVDCLRVYKSAVSTRGGEMIAPSSLRLLPLYILSLMKQTSLRLGSTASLDLRCYEMQLFKVLPFEVALLTIYPALYSLHDMTDEGAIITKSGTVPQPPRLLLSGEKLSRSGIFLMDAGQEFYIWVGKDTVLADIQCLFGVANYDSIPEDMGALPNLDNSLSSRVRTLIDYLQSMRTNHANLYVLRENSRMRMKFINKLMNDRTESMMSYHEFLVHIQGQIN